MSSDLMSRIALLEARLSLLERRVRRHGHAEAPGAAAAGAMTGPISYKVDQPGLIISDAYEIERDQSGRAFC